jgi:hypothetical protein
MSMHLIGMHLVGMHLIGVYLYRLLRYMNGMRDQLSAEADGMHRDEDFGDKEIMSIFQLRPLSSTSCMHFQH